jgi:hypothetical protein
MFPKMPHIMMMMAMRRPLVEEKSFNAGIAEPV